MRDSIAVAVSSFIAYNLSRTLPGTRRPRYRLEKLYNDEMAEIVRSILLCWAMQIRKQQQNII